MTSALLRRLVRLEARAGQALPAATGPILDRLRADPTQIFTRLGLEPDRWQTSLLYSDAPRMLLLCSRQAGKSQTAAAVALKTALLAPQSLILLLSPSLRQSGELFRDKFLPLYRRWTNACPARRETALELELANGSRIVSLPGTEQTIRGYSGVKLLVIDEASRVADALYCAVRPMVAVSHGRLVALSTPFGKRGWFHDEWHSTSSWERVRITAEECPRIPASFLAEERLALGPRWYRQEYECSFEETIDAVFSSEDIAAAFQHDGRPMFTRQP
jgi:hypothetical protein